MKYADKKAKIVNFGIGDYVLLANDIDVLKTKLHVIWRGSYRIIDAIHEFIYEVEDIVSGEKQESHVSRMKLYSDGSLKVTENIKT